MSVEITKHHGHHFLWIDGECWMWDLRTERRAQADLARRACGDVLVAGYGLGLVQKCLLVNRAVTYIRTVEKRPGVLVECERVFGELYGEVAIGNFFDLEEGPKFDCVLGDIWLDIAPEYLQEYVDFRRKAERLLKPDGRVLAWGDECFKIWEEKLCPAA